MNHLLTALIAAFSLVLPLHADEPTQTISVRVIDHEGEPISGLALSFEVDDRVLHGFTDHDGLLGPIRVASTDETQISVRIQPEHLVEVGDSQRVSILRPGEPGRWAVMLERHCKLVRSYAIPSLTEFDSGDVNDGIVTLQAPDAVRCVLRLRPVVWPAPVLPGHWGSPWISIWRPGGNSVQITEDEFSESLKLEPDGETLVSEHAIMVPRDKPTVIVVTYAGRQFAEEVSRELTSQSFELDLDIPFKHDSTSQLRFRLRADDPATGYCLVRLDGRLAVRLPVWRSMVFGNEEQTVEERFSFDVPSGDYVLLPAVANAVDTMLRLRRGEDLPHLKRITIPEGGTVELSTEDFLAPPAEAEAKDATP